MNYIVILYFYLTNPNEFLSVAEKFFDEISGASIYEDL